MQHRLMIGCLMLTALLRVMLQFSKLTVMLPLEEGFA